MLIKIDVKSCHFNPAQREKIKLNFYFHTSLLCSASKGFMKAFKVFIKPFEAPQRSVEIKNQVTFNTIFSGREALIHFSHVPPLQIFLALDFSYKGI